MATRDRIIECAISEFCCHGYHRPTLADIAQACGMSRGNLAYHFKDKELILDAIAERLTEDITSIQKSRKGYPAFANLSLDMRTYALLQVKYPFIFRDTSVLEHPSIRQVMSAWSKKTIVRNMESFAFAIEIGNMKPERYPGLYHHLAINAWLITYYWISQKAVRQINDNNDAERMVWSTIIPHFTEKGLKAFTSYYGEDYLKNLGEPLSNFTNQNLLF